jgi:KaiC/GvpD/RAD55 family RecA-like ATPase
MGKDGLCDGGMILFSQNDIKGNVSLLCVPPEKYIDSTVSLLKSVLEEGKAIYITASRPYDVFSHFLKSNGVDTDKMLFIDCISSITGIPLPGPNVRYIPTPTMLELITIHVDIALNENDVKYVILDSVSSLSIYNPERAVIEFLHYLVSRMRQRKVKTVLINIGENSVSQSLHMLCDGVLRI